MLPARLARLTGSFLEYGVYSGIYSSLYLERDL
jgi:hypothetical protein